MAGKPQTLLSFTKDGLLGPAQPEAKKFADTLSRDFNGDVLAVLYYGSCLRTGATDGLILDFYVLVDNYKKAHGHFFSSLGNALVPPNVYYREIKHKNKVVRAKVAVLSLSDFQKRVSPRGLNVSVWARFAQPARLLFAKTSHARDAVIKAVAEASKTMAREIIPILEGKQTAKGIWAQGLRKTYGSEFRSEGTSKALELFELNKGFFLGLTPLVLKELEGAELEKAGKTRRRWLMRTLNGKFVSLMRLIKAVFTFQGGIDYLAWKIKRSSGVDIVIKPWHRKVPLIAGIALFIQLRWKGAFR
ncbi:MAG: hypothetical protein V3R64_05980 [Sphingomonadales bacterium]